MTIFWIYAKKYWKQFLVILPSLIIIGWVIFKQLTKKKPTDPTLPQDDVTVVKAIQNIKDKLFEENLKATIQVTAAKTQEKAVLDNLQEVSKIEDDTERRAQLAALAKRR